MLDITAHVDAVAEAVYRHLDRTPRVLVALAGAPASGKSTLAEEVSRRLRRQGLTAVVVPMDGYHLDNRVLEARGLINRKGAPETFDAAGFVSAMQRLHRGDDVVLPVFDRARDIAIAGAIVVPANCQVIVVEGNYLLFDEPPWSDLAPLWHVSAMLDVPPADLRARLIQRWLKHGLSRTAATKRAESNDIPNAQRVMQRQLPPDLLLTTE